LDGGHRRLDQPGVTEQWQELACSPVFATGYGFFPVNSAERIF
jgi:hypothetical protein